MKGFNFRSLPENPIYLGSLAKANVDFFIPILVAHINAHITQHIAHYDLRDKYNEYKLERAQQSLRDFGNRLRKNVYKLYIDNIMNLKQI